MATRTESSVDNLAIRDQVGEEEWQVRCDLAACYRLVAHFGWDELIFTHLSARLPGPDMHFLINPFGMLFEEITASSLVKVDLQGEKVMPSRYAVNPAGFVIHSAVHEARQDAHAVLHVHTVEGVAVSAQKEGLLPISQDALTLWGDVAYHDYEGLALEEDEKARLVGDLGDKNVMILRNHGLLTVGSNVAEAFLRLFFIQRSCEMQVAAQAGGAELIHQPDSMGKRVAGQAQSGFEGGARLTWPAMLRKADRLDPSYKT